MWHEISLEDVRKKLSSHLTKGLSSAEAALRLKQYGPNVLPRGKRLTLAKTFLKQFRSPLVYILLIAAALTAIFAEWIDMSVILLAVFVNVSVGFFQEFRSGNILKKLREVVTIRALVVRDGEMHEVPAQNVIPGDIIVLKQGMKVPADARVISAKRLEIDEALLTGESAPVGKREGVLMEGDTAIGDRFNMVHMGTIIARGEGRALVVGTGKETEIGKIALLTVGTEEEPTPLQLRIGRLGKFLAYLIGSITVAIFAIGIFQDIPPLEMFKTAVAVAVAAIPEGLPAAISIVLAVSAQKILKRNGVVKHLLAAETLGSATIICADKTGTLTEGKMKVEKLIVYGDEAHARENLALANEAVVEKLDGTVLVRGELTDQAKMRVFLDAGGNLRELLKTMPRISLLPFDSSRKYLASLHNVSLEFSSNEIKSDSNKPFENHSRSFEKDSKRSILFVSGAPEALLLRSVRVAKDSAFFPLGEKERRKIVGTYEELAKKGYRMIAIAEREFKEAFTEEEGDLEEESVRERLISDLTFVGLAAIRDPIRPDVKESIRIAREAGIRPIMVTGDHLLTARAIGEEIGLRVDADGVIEGKEFGEMSDEEFSRRIQTAEIFARVNPEHKMRIVHVLQKQGHSVGMTGDGVNDAPALKAADIGIAVDSGTDVSKEASDLILLNNSFSIIVEAIRRGRIAFDNIRKVAVFLLVDSFTEVLLISAALVGRIWIPAFPLPITALQILWVNLVEDTLPNVALSFEPGEKDIMRRKPLAKNEPILDRESKIIIFAAGLGADILLVGLFLIFYFFSTLPLPEIRTFVFATVGLNSFFYIYSVKSLRHSIFRSNPFNNNFLTGATIIGVGLMLFAIYAPFMNTVLETVPLSIFDWGIVVGICILQVIGIEFVKWFFFGRKRTPSLAAQF